MRRRTLHYPRGNAGSPEPALWGSQGGPEVLYELATRIRDAVDGQVALLGLPYDENSSFRRGCAAAPPFIRAEVFTDASNMWTESGVDLGAPGALIDAGDLEPCAWSEADPAIEAAVSLLLEAGCRPLCLGGDHSVTWPAVRAFGGRLGRIDILHIDAHPDLHDRFMGSPASHASPFARIMESGLAGRLVQAGIRTVDGLQREQAGRFGVETIMMADWARTARLSFERPVYLSVDMDGLDPSAAPGVSHREPGGPSMRQVLEVIGSLRGAIVGADIVEMNPSCDPSGMTATVAAKLVKEIAGRMRG